MATRSMVFDRLHALALRGPLPQETTDHEEVRAASEAIEHEAAELRRELEYATDLRLPPAFTRAPGEPVPWAHRGVASDRTTTTTERRAA